MTRFVAHFSDDAAILNFFTRPPARSGSQAALKQVVDASSSLILSGVPMRRPRPSISPWVILSVWLTLSLACLLWLEYRNALRGVLCMTGASQSVSLPAQATRRD